MCVAACARARAAHACVLVSVSVPVPVAVFLPVSVSVFVPVPVSVSAPAPAPATAPVCARGCADAVVPCAQIRPARRHAARRAPGRFSELEARNKASRADFSRLIFGFGSRFLQSTRSLLSPDFILVRVVGGGAGVGSF